ncbi:MAG: ArsA family ATPase [Myxococcales bacterium]|nr:ArsA family ATPase [Myxococcales bacterium]MCB9749711.1 ArsA family ATPase [Myxococcales bacterium]
MLDALARRELLIVSGKGGVGRTAMSAMLGLELARRGRRVLVATVGQDDRLAWMLGHRALADVPRELAPGLFIQRVVPHVCVREYGSMILKSERLSSAVFGNKLMRRLLRAIPGLDDYAVLGKLWHVACRARSFDTVIFDGPATGHLRYNLGVPRTILNTVPRGPLTAEAQRMVDALEDPARVQAVLVGLPARWPLTELGELAASLREELHMEIGAIFVNGMWPAEVPAISPAALPASTSDAVRAFFSVTHTIAEQAHRQQANVDAWMAGERGAGRSPVALEIPWRWEGLSSLEDMQALCAALPECVVRSGGVA